MVPKTFDVALSYASRKKKQRAYVADVYYYITAKGFEAFQDKARAADLWGEDLKKKLPKVFYRESKWCIMFISKEYRKSTWAMLEKRAILARQTKSPRYVLPVRFDATTIPGLDPDLGYVNAKDYSPSELADLFEKRYFKK